MVFMLPRTAEHGARLAALLPSAMRMLAPTMFPQVAGDLPPKRCVIVLVADGLGIHNLEPVKGHARTLWKLLAGSFETVVPSTTGAALATITTGTLPGQHGLMGYRIRHPQLGMRTTLSEWKGIDAVREWQLQPTLFERGQDHGVRSYAIGRPSHRDGGLTRAVLTGATYLAAQTVEDRVAQALTVVREATSPTLVYLYVDELDRAGHSEGSSSDAWLRRLEQLDDAVKRLVSELPSDAFFVGTADHGMVDISSDNHILFTAGVGAFNDVSFVGGEPRLRYLYLTQPEAAQDVQVRLQDHFGDRVWVYTREEAFHSGHFGAVDPSLADRVGEIVVAARDDVALYEHDADPKSLMMVGQHGSFTRQEREVPLFMYGDDLRERHDAWLTSYATSLAPKRRKARRK